MSRPPGRFSNSMMAWLLRSPLHGLLSKNFMLITVTGRKSGKSLTTPVNYVRDGADLLIVSWRDRTWWKNLRGGAPVTLRLQGRDHIGFGIPIEDAESVAKNLLVLIRQSPAYQKHFAINLTPDGQPTDPEALMQLAQPRVIVRVTNLK